MLFPILALAIAVIFYVYYKYPSFYKKRLYPNLAWTCALALSTAWELAIQIMIDGVEDKALITRSEMLLTHVDTIVTASITIAVALVAMLFLRKKPASEE